MTLGKIIKEYRVAHQMSMDTFSERSGISKAYISLLEKNKHPKTGKEITPSIQSIKQAAHGMSMDFNELFSMLDGNVTLDSYLPEDSMESPKIRKRVAKNLNKILNAKGMSPSELSKRSGVSKSSISHYLNGDHAPSEENAIKLSKILDVNHFWLMGFDSPMYDSKFDEAEAEFSHVIDLYKKLNRPGKDMILERMQTLLDCGYVQQPDAYVEHADAIRQVRELEEARKRKNNIS